MIIRVLSYFVNLVQINHLSNVEEALEFMDSVEPYISSLMSRKQRGREKNPMRLLQEVTSKSRDFVLLQISRCKSSSNMTFSILTFNWSITRIHNDLPSDCQALIPCSYTLIARYGLKMLVIHRVERLLPLQPDSSRVLYCLDFLGIFSTFRSNFQNLISQGSRGSAGIPPPKIC